MKIENCHYRMSSSNNTGSDSDRSVSSTGPTMSSLSQIANVLSVIHAIPYGRSAIFYPDGTACRERDPQNA